jgi:hypothetical protein
MRSKTATMRFESLPLARDADRQLITEQQPELDHVSVARDRVAPAGGLAPARPVRAQKWPEQHRALLGEVVAAPGDLLKRTPNRSASSPSEWCVRASNSRWAISASRA